MAEALVLQLVKGQNRPYHVQVGGTYSLPM
jgi:hypothetical protein